MRWEAFWWYIGLVERGCKCNISHRTIEDAHQKKDLRGMKTGCKLKKFDSLLLKLQVVS